MIAETLVGFVDGAAGLPLDATMIRVDDAHSLLKLVEDFVGKRRRAPRG